MQELGAELLAIHLECVPQGTVMAKERGLAFPLANDHTLAVARLYSPTTTYVIGRDGRIEARWLDRIHDRAAPARILGALGDPEQGGP